MNELDPLRVAMSAVGISTIAELAERAKLSPATINRAMYESGTTVHLKSLIKLGTALNLGAQETHSLIAEMRSAHADKLATQAQEAERAA